MSEPERKFPRACKCGRLLTSPPPWLKVLEAMAPGRGQQEPVLGSTAVSERLKVTRQRAHKLVSDAHAAGALERLPESSVYRRTWMGRQVLGRWKTAIRRKPK